MADSLEAEVDALEALAPADLDGTWRAASALAERLDATLDSAQNSAESSR